ncbi:junctional sarcoplasmic reticulum protein 1-like [Macrobrachium rosenbergii]|uniref:junctional sarcoplasmic reticulum protein 1-like n=1 Tax=Macrobrachium rosenbergii TaxID=79674 RepID=UPI0034D4C1EB
MAVLTSSFDNDDLTEPISSSNTLHCCHNPQRPNPPTATPSQPPPEGSLETSIKYGSYVLNPSLQVLSVIHKNRLTTKYRLPWYDQEGHNEKSKSFPHYTGIERGAPSWLTIPISSLIKKKKTKKTHRLPHKEEEEEEEEEEEDYPSSPSQRRRKRIPIIASLTKKKKKKKKNTHSLPHKEEEKEE